MLRKIFLGLLIFIGLAIIVLAAMFYRPDLSRDDLVQYINEQSKFIELPSGAMVHYRDQGNPNGPVIALVHGQLGSLHDWELWIPYLKDKYRIITMDRPANGLTGRTPIDFYSVGSNVKLLEEFFKELEIEKMIIVGHSAGGSVSLRYALENQEQLNGLVLIGSGGATTLEEWRDVNEYAAETMEQSMNGKTKDVRDLSFSEKLMSKMASPSLVEDGLKSMFGDETLVSDEMITRYSKLMRHKGNRFAQSLMSYHGYAEVGPENYVPRLHEIKIPTLLMFGEKDQIVTVDIAHKFDKLIDNTQLIIYNGVGHIPQIEVHEQSVQDLLTFIEGKINTPLAETKK